MAAEPASGSRVGAYILDRKLGGGSFGSVWLARHADDGSLVAIKLLTGAQASGDRAAVRAEVELLAASASSRSQHVVRVLGGGIDPLPYIIMEYVEGRDLSQLIADRGALPPADVVPLGLAIADALQALMDAGIIHRDVKPANVLIDANGTAKLADFGIAKIVGMDTVTMTGQLPMTMAYAAPEVWEGTVSHQSDIYALGAVLYQLLAGAPPFSGNYGALYKAHASEEPDFDRLPANTPPSLRRLVAACLQKQPDDRPKDAAAVAEILHLAAAELTAPPSPEPTHFGPWQKRGPHPSQAWAWRCVHEQTGERATVEVRAFQTLAEGERLRKAVAINPSLVSFGAERVIEVNRLLLAPNEAFPEEPPAPFLFWVARDEQASTPPTGEISTNRLRKTLDALTAMLAAASAAGVALSFDAPNLALLADGSVTVRRPGLAEPAGDAGEAAVAFLSALPLEEDARALVAGADGLGDLSRALAASSVAFGVAHASSGHADAAAIIFPSSAAASIAGGAGPERFVEAPPAAAGGGRDEPPTPPTALRGFGGWLQRYPFAVSGAAATLLAAVAIGVAVAGPFDGGGNGGESTPNFGNIPHGDEPTRTPRPKRTPTPTKTPTVLEQFLRECAADPACVALLSAEPTGSPTDGRATPTPFETVGGFATTPTPTQGTTGGLTPTQIASNDTATPRSVAPSPTAGTNGGGTTQVPDDPTNTRTPAPIPNLYTTHPLGPHGGQVVGTEVVFRWTIELLTSWGQNPGPNDPNVSPNYTQAVWRIRINKATTSLVSIVAAGAMRDCSWFWLNPPDDDVIVVSCSPTAPQALGDAFEMRVLCTAPYDRFSGHGVPFYLMSGDLQSYVRHDGTNVQMGHMSVGFQNIFKCTNP